MINLSSPDEVVRVLDGHPHARFSTGTARGVAGPASPDGAVLWWGDTAFGRLGLGYTHSLPRVGVLQ